jgi:hypothetical protein
MTTSSAIALLAPDHVVTINYSGDRPGPTPDILKVKLLDSIAFKSEQVPSGQTMQVSFENPEFFSAAVYREGDPAIMVMGEPPQGQGTYRCELVSAASEGVPSGKIPGGSVEIDRPGNTR